MSSVLATQPLAEMNPPPAHEINQGLFLAPQANHHNKILCISYSPIIQDRARKGIPIL